MSNERRQHEVGERVLVNHVIKVPRHRNHVVFDMVIGIGGH